MALAELLNEARVQTPDDVIVLPRSTREALAEVELLGKIRASARDAFSCRFTQRRAIDKDILKIAAFEFKKSHQFLCRSTDSQACSVESDQVAIVVPKRIGAGVRVAQPRGA